MKSKLLLVVLLLISTASQVFAQGPFVGPYVGASGGVTMTSDSDVTVAAGSGALSYDTGYGLGLSAGYNFGGARLEGEFGYKVASLENLSTSNINFNITDSDLKVTSYMINGYLDHKSDSGLIMFIGAGVGVINAKFDGDGSSIDDTVFGYQATIGASVAANKNINVDLFYRYMAAGTDFEKDGIKINYNSSNVYLGLRYNF